MADLFGAEYPTITPPEQAASQLGSGVNPSGQSLLEALAQIQQIQQRPLIPQNPIAQLGVALQGYNAGWQGQENPTIRQTLAIKQQELNGVTNAIHTGIQLEHLGLQKQQFDLNQQMEQRRIAHEQAMNEKNLSMQRFQVRSTMVKDLFSMAKDNPLYEQRALDEMAAMYKDAGIPTPPGGFSFTGMRDMVKQGKPVALAILADPSMPDPVIAKTYNVEPEAVTGIRTLLNTPGPARDLWSKNVLGHSFTELSKDTVALDKAKADTAKAKIDAMVSTREYQLTAKLTRTPQEQSELMQLQNFGKAPNEERDLARSLIEKEGLPLDLAIPKAARIMAEAKNQSDFKDIVKAIKDSNPKLSQGEAVLAAYAQQRAAKSDFGALETQLETMKDFMSRLKEYSGEVNTSESKLGAIMSGAVRGAASYVRNDLALEGLQRKQGELANVMRFLGEKGVISDRDVQRGMLLLPTIWKSGPVARDSIRELDTIVTRGEKALEKRRQAATTIGGPSTPPAKPNDPYGLRD